MLPRSLALSASTVACVHEPGYAKQRTPVAWAACAYCFRAGASTLRSILAYCRGLTSRFPLPPSVLFCCWLVLAHPPVFLSRRFNCFADIGVIALDRKYSDEQRRLQEEGEQRSAVNVAGWIAQGTERARASSSCANHLHKPAICGALAMDTSVYTKQVPSELHTYFRFDT